MKNDYSYARQQVYDIINNKIIDEPLKYWKSINDISNSIKNDILKLSEHRVICDSRNEYFCSKCLNKLDKEFYCSECGCQRAEVSNENTKYVNMNVSDVKNIRFSVDEFNYYLFDVVFDEVLLYELNVKVKYERDEEYKFKLVNDIEIKNVFHILEEGVFDLINDKAFTYHEIDYFFERYDTNYFLDVNSLDCLKKARLYKYSCIWQIKEYFNKNSFSVESITYYPVHFEQFEYLVKMGLFKLALTGVDLLRKGRNFKEIFGVDKKYYSFMKEIDIDREQLQALRFYPTDDIELVNFICSNVWLAKALCKYVDLKKLKVYFEDENLADYNLSEYSDYIDYCEELGLNLKDKKVLYPKGFMACHDDVMNRLVLMNSERIDEKIHTLSNFLELNVYDDGKFVIFPANSVSSLIDESSQMSNCVRNYCDSIGNNDCQIYFMRYKDCVDKSLVTIEVINGKIVQARTKFNQEPSDEMWEVLYKWERQLVPVFKNEEE